MKRLIGLLMMSAALLCADFDSQDGGVPAAVPEPATIGMLGIGVGAIAFGAWRKSRKR